MFPFDPIPRLIGAAEWENIEKGLIQRTEALNLFLRDIYGDQKILRDGLIDPELIYGATSFRREMIGMLPPRGIYTHVVGTDLIRDQHGTFLVLEDNARNPSGVSYVLQCREVMKRVFRVLFEHYGVRPVTTTRCTPRGDTGRRPRDVTPNRRVLTPGSTTRRISSTLWRARWGPLVEGRDLDQRRCCLHADDGGKARRRHFTAGSTTIPLDPAVFRPIRSSAVWPRRLSQRAGCAR